MPELLQTLAIMQPQCVSLLWWMAVFCATSLPARKTTYDSSQQPADLTRHYCSLRVHNNDLSKHVYLVQQVPLIVWISDTPPWYSRLSSNSKGLK